MMLSTGITIDRQAGGMHHITVGRNHWYVSPYVTRRLLNTLRHVPNKMIWAVAVVYFLEHYL